VPLPFALRIGLWSSIWENVTLGLLFILVFSVSRGLTNLILLQFNDKVKHYWRLFQIANTMSTQAARDD
jgi:hypothetical protein